MNAEQERDQTTQPEETTPNADPTTAAKEPEMQPQTNEPNAAAQFEENIAATAKAVAEEAAKAEKSAQTAPVSAEEYEKLKQELDEAKDRSLRALAELENFRARSNRLAQEERKYASLDLGRAILPIWDNLGRAIAAGEQGGTVETLLEGVKMVHNEFVEVLAKNGIERIDALYKPFDPNVAESIAFAPNDEYPANTVVFETQAGFKLHDRVVRPAQVVLAAPTPKPQPAENAENPENAAE